MPADRVDSVMPDGQPQGCRIAVKGGGDGGRGSDRITFLSAVHALGKLTRAADDVVIGFDFGHVPQSRIRKLSP